MAEDAATERRTDAVDRVRDRAAELAPAFGSTWTDDEPWRFLTDLTAIGSRMAGSEGEARGADLVADAFERAGLADVRTEPFDLPAWERGSASLDVTVSGRGGEPTTRSFEALALPYSPGGSVSGELVDVGYGTPAEIDERDVAGRIAVASTTTPEGGRFVHRMEKFGYAVDAGAVGFVFVNHLDGQLPPTGSLTFGEEAEAVAVGVSKETGAWLREYAVGGGGAGPSGSGAVAQAELSVEASTTPGESRNVIGRAGPDTDERVLLLAHYDAHDIAEGALDNGCGIATVATAAEIIAGADLPLGVDVVAVGAEEVGLLGAEHLAERVDLDSVKGVVNVDGAGRFRDLIALAHASTAAASVAEAVSAATRQPIEVDAQPHPFSDQWPFVRRGVPALQLHSDSGDRGRGWGHTHADTRDKVDDRNVREHAMLTALLVAEFAAPERDLPRLDRDELVTAFREADFETGMRAADLWPSDWD
ncbi:aminopeptidase [Halorubrum ezzemoulense DSM 17463]|uniref:Carboxypeptidase Q n=2 Tax=Halorubrum ezzemoulense TaxID=337243 RepID=A0A1X4G9G7_HALEZ|nr:M28 family metallopeptidase [Halorubrum ezzemoulense]MDB2240952.1 M28 family metallopeptidase [Halorubrum ezzemoulense]MDB2264584.1 M28 family metallopeptidase [Halorubrum ezzemoulense]OSO93834.1 aminopeptidase [Halorubrum ezzemoulense DSM 17463]OYR83858.1 aminopeptidase [Halorubrum ezzemoulense]QAY20144.1 M28 family peptidase [Halorubrum ezzemoulense]